MNIDQIKDYLMQYKNKTCFFRYIGSRNHIEEFIGKIINIYNCVFIIEDNNSRIRSFTYNDLAMKSIKIIDK